MPILGILTLVDPLSRVLRQVLVLDLDWYWEDGSGVQI